MRICGLLIALPGGADRILAAPPSRSRDRQHRCRSLALRLQRTHDHLPQLSFLVAGECLICEEASYLVAGLRAEIPLTGMFVKRGAQPLERIRVFDFRAGKPARSLRRMGPEVVC